MKTCGWVIVASCILQACGVRAEADTGAVLDTIAQINHINWIVNTIRTYNNVVVLEEEYDKISPGRLNLNRIPDEETLGRITKMLDTLHRLRMEERELHRWQESFNAMRQKQLRDFWIKQAGSVDVGGHRPERRVAGEPSFPAVRAWDC